MEERGEIEVKGKGKMCTYFLQRNQKVTESEIMGFLVPSADSERKTNHSTRASQLLHYRPALEGRLNVSLLIGYVISNGIRIGVPLYTLKPKVYFSFCMRVHTNFVTRLLCMYCMCTTQFL